jgi:kumamolisin
MPEAYVAVAGSRRPAKSDAVRVRDVAPDTEIEVTLTLRGRDLPAPDHVLSRDELTRDYGASDADVEQVTRTLEGKGLTVEESSPATRSLRVKGSAAQIEATFRPSLGIYHSPEQGEFRGREGRVQVPAEIGDIVTGVFGLDERRVARRAAGAPAVAAPAAVREGLGPAELERHYRFPDGDGTGQTIAIAEFGGGYLPADLADYCARWQRPVPHVTPVAVGLQPLTLDDLRRLPKQQQMQELNETGEVMMDVEIVAGLCPGADIVVYFAPFTQKGWVDLLNRLIAGDPGAAGTLSVSWGLPEDHPDLSASARNAINERLHAAALLGITVCVASGDDGSGDQLADGRAHVDFPASSPFVLAVGGTMLDGADEVVWWEAPGVRTRKGGGSTGGGVSDVFPRPAWQSVDVASLNLGSIDGRVVPDVAALSGPPFYNTELVGRSMPNGGTSASTPLWAALIARLAAAKGQKLPFLPPRLYAIAQTPAGAGQPPFVDVTSGDNTSPQPGRGYKAAAGYDAVSGWGVPDGKALLSLL